MTRLELHRDLSYCEVDDHLVFLDIENDRYFCLTERLESALVKYLRDGDTSCDSIRPLIDRKILVEGSADLGHPSNSTPPFPTRSATEDASSSRRANLRELLDTFAIVFSIQRQLKTRSLKQTLHSLTSYRQSRASQAFLTHQDDSHIMAASAAFRSARLYVPIDTCCLLDSIALITFLAKRALYADLVFGVARDPFSAHCWAQHGGTVLNDALGHAMTFTPIRVI